MGKIVIGVALRDRLGEDGARALSEYMEQHADTWRTDVVNSCIERVDGRLHTYARRDDVAEGFEKIINKLADLRVELVRWSFASWLGQIAVIMGAMFMMFRLLAP